MNTPIAVPRPAVKPMTSGKAFAVIAQICAEALYVYSEGPAESMELNGWFQRIKSNMDLIAADPLLAGSTNPATRGAL